MADNLVSVRTPEPRRATAYTLALGDTLVQSRLVVAFPWHPATDAFRFLHQPDAPQHWSLWLNPVPAEDALRYLGQALSMARRAGRSTADLEELYAALAQDDVRLCDVSMVLGRTTPLRDISLDRAHDRLTTEWTQWLEEARPTQWIMRVPSGSQEDLAAAFWPIGLPPHPYYQRLGTHHLRTWFPARRPPLRYPGGWLLGRWANQWVAPAPVSHVTITGPARSGRSSAARWLALQWILEAASSQAGLVIEDSPEPLWALWGTALGHVISLDPALPPRLNLLALDPAVPRERTVEALVAIVHALSLWAVHEDIPPALDPLIRTSLETLYDQAGLSDDPATWVSAEGLAWGASMRPMPTFLTWIAAIETGPIALRPLAVLLREGIHGPLAGVAGTVNDWRDSEHTPPVTVLSCGVLVTQYPGIRPMVNEMVNYIATLWSHHTTHPDWVLTDAPGQVLEVSTAFSAKEIRWARVTSEAPSAPRVDEALWCMPGTSDGLLTREEQQVLVRPGDSFWIAPHWRAPLRIVLPENLRAIMTGELEQSAETGKAAL